MGTSTANSRQRVVREPGRCRSGGSRYERRHRDPPVQQGDEQHRRAGEAESRLLQGHQHRGHKCNSAGDNLYQTRNESTHRLCFEERSARKIIKVIPVEKEDFHVATESAYLTIDSKGPWAGLSLVDASVSSSAASFDALACAIARWKSSQRCRADSFLSVAAGDSVSVVFLDILSRRRVLHLLNGL